VICDEENNPAQYRKDNSFMGLCIYQCLSASNRSYLFWGNNLSKSVTQSEEEMKQMIIDSLKDIEWDIMQGKTDAVMTKLEEAQKLTREWKGRKT
jgi:hypothetical protein